MEQNSIRRVSEDRWHDAQQAERKLWIESQKKRGWKRLVWPIARPVLSLLHSKRVTGDDWNFWWQDRFAGYAFLPSHVGDYIELGCGPYTNTRLILKNRTADRIVCSDPLISTYLEFTGRWLAEAFRSGKVEIDDHPVEEIPFPPESFDVVVMINVLEHVRDANTCMQVATGLVRPGGYLLLGNRLIAVDQLGYDPFHPIRLRRSDLEPYLADFDPIIHDELDPEHAAGGPDPDFANLIFAGRKRS